MKKQQNFLPFELESREKLKASGETMGIQQQEFDNLEPFNRKSNVLKEDYTSRRSTLGNLQSLNVNIDAEISTLKSLEPKESLGSNHNSTIQDTWLRKLMSEFDISMDYYVDIFNSLISTNTDVAEKCESLESLLLQVSSGKREQFVRSSLQSLEEKGVDSLLNPNLHSQILKKTNVGDKIRHLNVTKFEQELENSILLHINTMDLNEDGLVESAELEPMQLLQSIFSDLPLEKLQSSLLQCNYSIERTIQLLLADNDEFGQQQPVAKQVCRHFLVGQCYRSDCWFSHDPDALVCKFWLRGTCYKGDKCEFSHGQNIAQLREQHTESISAKSVKPVSKKESLKEDFPQLGNVPKPKLNFLSPSKPFNTTLKNATPNSSNLSMQSYSNTNHVNGSSRERLDMKWLSTGDTLNASYMSHRQDAINVALERNKLFQKYFID